MPDTALALIGGAAWCFALAGWGIGTGYQHFHHAFDYVSIAVVALAVTAGAPLVYRRRPTASVEPSIDET